MLLPETWGTHSRDEAGSAKRRKGRREAPAAPPKRRKVVEVETAPTEHVDVYDTVSRAISCSRPAVAAALELDSILSRVPYREMLEELFGGTGRLPVAVPVVTRAYEESFMRSVAAAGERACAMGASCECMFVDAGQPFVGTEFVIPMEEPSAENPQLCVLCCRKVTQQLFHEMLFEGVSFRGVIQRYGNVCEHAGEYAREAMLICPPNGHVHCMPLPIVAHQRNRYSVFVQNGVKFLRQHRVYFEDFAGFREPPGHVPPPSSTAWAQPGSAARRAPGA
jgi:hypothetical protein